MYSTKSVNSVLTNSKLSNLVLLIGDAGGRRPNSMPWVGWAGDPHDKHIKWPEIGLGEWSAGQ